MSLSAIHTNADRTAPAATGCCGCERTRCAGAMPIRKLLVANRGEIARRVMRSARAGASPPSRCTPTPTPTPPTSREADEAVRLPGASPADTYLRIDAVVDAARRTGADAVHPGYGFLSENAAFAAACAEAGLVFVGPPPAAIEAMGSKLAAKAMMAAASVPTLPTVHVGRTGRPMAPARTGRAVEARPRSGGRCW